MNNYITLDGKKYKTPSKQWQPVSNKPATVRNTLLGEIDATFGSAAIDEWQGQIEGPVTPTDGTWGAITDLRTSLRKNIQLVMTDHYGVAYDVVVFGPLKEESLMPMWDSPSNIIAVTARIIKVKAHV